MNGKLTIILGVAGLALAALACQAVAGGGAATSTPIPPTDTVVLPTEIFPTESPSGGGAVILSDDFSASHWGTGTDADSSIEYTDQALQMIVFTKDYFVWSTPNNQDYENIHLEVTVLNNNTDATTAFGLMCNQQPDADGSFYYFVITPAGQYAIVRATTGESDLFLTNSDAWGTSSAIAQNAASYRVGADCGNGTLTLYVDGQQIDSISDSAYTRGGVGLLTWSGEDATNTNVSFDDFLMTELP